MNAGRALLQVVQNVVRFSSPVIKFGAVACGDFRDFELLMTSSSKTEQLFEFKVPPESHLRIMPTIGSLSAGGTCRLHVRYAPPIKLSETPATVAGMQEGAGGNAQSPAPPPQLDAADNDAEGHTPPAEVDGPAASSLPSGVWGEGPEPWSEHRKWTIPCFLKGQPYRMHLTVCTAAVVPVIVADVADEVVFGDLALGQEAVAVITLTNRSAELLELVVRPLDPLGPFSILGLPRNLAPLGSKKLRVVFRPLHQCRYLEDLTLIGPGLTNRMTFHLNGRGVSPTYTFDMPKELDLGDCLVGESVEKDVTLVNTASFALTYKIDISNTGQCNVNAVEPFLALPAEATVPAGGTQVIKLLFKPDSPSEYFSANVRLVVANQPGSRTCTITARSWAYAMYYYGGDAPTPQERSTLINRFAPLTKEPLPPRQIRLTFTETKFEADFTATRQFEIGNCNGPAKKDVGDFVLELPPDAAKLGFKIDPLTSTVENGKRKAVLVSYKPIADPEGAALGQWNEFLVKGVLGSKAKGVPAPPGDGWKFELKLRAYMPGSLERAGVSLQDSAPAPSRK